MKYLSLITIGLCMTTSQAFLKEEFGSQWELYKKANGKVYDAEEDSLRFLIFEENRRKISEHNEKYRTGEVSYRVNINQFTDMTEFEVKSTMNGLKGPLRQTGIPYIDDGEEVAATVDWRSKGIVTPVKNQGQCGSCWIFSGTGSLEGQEALKIGKLAPLSEQNIIDCDKAASGCSGGFPDLVFEFVQSNGGIDSEKSYPYTGEAGTCHFNKKTIGATCSGHVDLPQGDENALTSAVAKVGPISVGIDASNWSFQQYAGGVYDEPNCSSSQLDHAVLVVGYGTENGKDYWLVKNSWGPQWGEAGYIKMTRNGNNQCGIATQASYPLV